MFFFLFAALALPSLYYAQLAPSPSQAQPCFIEGFVLGPVSESVCPGDLVCVLSSFGLPAADQPRTGICQFVPSTPPLCSVGTCSFNGANALCVVRGTSPSSLDLVATCGAWATRRDAVPVECPSECPTECVQRLLVANDGSTFCNLCQLQSASCISNFEIFGPIDPSVAEPSPVVEPTPDELTSIEPTPSEPTPIEPIPIDAWH